MQPSKGFLGLLHEFLVDRVARFDYVEDRLLSRVVRVVSEDPTLTGVSERGREALRSGVVLQRMKGPAQRSQA